MAPAPAHGKRSLSQSSVADFFAPKRAKIKTKDQVPIVEAPAQDPKGGVEGGPTDGDEDEVDDPENAAKNITIQGPDLTSKPLSNLRDIIQDLLHSAKKGGLQHFVDANSKFYIRVGTLCSGTDAPLHVLNLFGMLKNANGDQVFTTINKFACEIEPFKQGFLLRNSKPELLFRDATDFAKPGAKQA